MTSLFEELTIQGTPVGYVSFLSALVHHGAMLDCLAVIQVASLDRAGSWETQAGPVVYYLLPRDLWFGFYAGRFEGETVPVATPEKALLDWCWLAEELGVDPRLETVEWGVLDMPRLDLLATESGIDYRRLLPAPWSSHHDQDRQRAEDIGRLRQAQLGEGER